jgi:hypothetical protein
MRMSPSAAPFTAWRKRPSVSAMISNFVSRSKMRIWPMSFLVT